MSHRKQSAFTLIELLVVIAIIAILLCLLVAAVQHARETASRLTCKNNLRQIGLALHQYHDAKGAFPAGYVSKVASDGSNLGPGWGWGAAILPYFEQQALQKQIRFDLDIADPANAAARKLVLAVYRCPSDPAPATFTTETVASEVAFSSYVGMFGTPEISDDPDKGNGVFYRNSHTRMLDITDGTSNTLLVGERHSYLAYSTWTGAVTGATVPPNHPSTLGSELAGVLCLGHTGDAAEGHTPNSPANHVDDFGSFHTSGVNFLFVDGTVRVINNSINVNDWVALGTRAGKEVISKYDF